MVSLDYVFDLWHERECGTKGVRRKWRGVACVWQVVWVAHVLYIAYRGEETSEIKIERKKERSQCVLCACKMCNLFTDI